MPDLSDAPTAGVRIGVDIGGTFTDLVLCQPDQTLLVAKISSTPHDASEAVIRGLEHIIALAGVAPAAVTEVVHGTTVASNTILQKVGARTGLLTTRGFRDVLEIGRIRTPGMFDLAWSKPEPIVPRRWRLEVTERRDATGEVITPLVEDEVRAAGRRFVAEGVESVAICFLNSYIDPAHEIAAERLLAAEFPSLLVTPSYAVLPEIKEYERTSTTVVNAYILPAMQVYLRRLADALRAMGITAPLQVMASNGGMMGAAVAASRPVFAVASGPAGGVTGAARLARALARPDAIAFDMGGTTAKAAIVEGGQPVLTTEYEFRDGISAPSRFIKGGGYMLKVPAIDIAEVGSGGGSLAGIDAGGLLIVGPQSAGADPGPACYGRGNPRPTVTDANMVLGYLNPQALAGGSLAVDPRLAAAAIQRHVAEPLGIGLVEAAHGIRAVANATMARAIRAVTIERGRDPRELTLLAFGGGGPLHAAAVARLLGIREVIAPVMSGVFSALGMLSADAEHNFVRAVLRPLPDMPVDRVRAVVELLSAEGRAVLAAEGYHGDAVALRLLADLRYLGQSSELSVPFAVDELTPGLHEVLKARFQALYRGLYGYEIDEPLELVNLRLAAVGRRDSRLAFEQLSVDPRALDGASGERPVSFTRESGYVTTPLIARRDVTESPREGPLVIESYDTTILVPPDAAVRRDRAGNVIITLR